MLEKTLQKLGLSGKEIKVYLACLTLGPSPVRKIAQESGINRGTAYDILKALIDLGLVSYYQKNKHQYFIAEDPQNLKNTLEDKLQKLESIKVEVSEIIPQLKSIYDNAGTKPTVKFYEGLNGIKTILQDVINCTKQSKDKFYYAYSSATIKSYLYQAYEQFSDDRIKEGIKVKVISIGPGGKTQGLDERRWLTDKESAPTYTLIYAGKTAMISVDPHDQPLGFIIEDKNIYQTQKMMFEFFWEKL